VPVTLRGDASRLRQLCGNLIDNAIKFTDIGGITFRVQTERENGDSVMLRFSMKDTGIGISAGQQHLLFTPFSQLSCWVEQ